MCEDIKKFPFSSVLQEPRVPDVQEMWHKAAELFFRTTQTTIWDMAFYQMTDLGLL